MVAFTFIKTCTGTVFVLRRVCVLCFVTSLSVLCVLCVFYVVCVCCVLVPAERGLQNTTVMPGAAEMNRSTTHADLPTSSDLLSRCGCRVSLFVVRFFVVRFFVVVVFSWSLPVVVVRGPCHGACRCPCRPPTAPPPHPRAWNRRTGPRPGPARTAPTQISRTASSPSRTGWPPP